jgi:hypothetical protein
MKRITSIVGLAGVVLAALAAVATAGTNGPPIPAGSPVPARLAGLYTAHFTTADQQTAGTWHLRLGPRHRAEVWNTLDGLANTPTFEAGPVSFRGNRMIFGRLTAQGVCTVGATYTWSLRQGLLRFRVVGTDGCSPRPITFAVHAWRRVT